RVGRRTADEFLEKADQELAIPVDALEQPAFLGLHRQAPLVRTHPDANGSHPRRKAIDHHRQVGEAVNRALVPSRHRTRQTLGGCGMEGETTMTKQPRGPRLGKLDLTRRTILAGGAAVVLVPTYWKQASAQEKRILIR